MTGSCTDCEKMAHVDAWFQGVEYIYISALARDDQDGDSDSNIDNIEGLDLTILEEDSSSTHSDSEITDTTERPLQPSSCKTQTATIVA